ncbi:MAG TPA: 7-cyano-7-deazaguanine synthase QueC [Lentisphaeria bacterium]|nr:MAG: 7-cyano-7-deazaguanine synthase QueC [Lentisphaerae bacterium GWF2_49_21]HBC89740.1 7-cyano-7-deazaguanine synthase QueC [Lentisphaeria bacterium]
MKKKAVVLLSGGLDSATILAYAVKKGFECYAISFDYGQRHRLELRAAGRVARHFHAAHHFTVKIDLRKWGGSALTSSKIKVPKSGIHRGIPVTYVPARNTIFLSFAVAWAETIGAKDIFIGVNSLDYSGYPDCRPQFIKAFAKCANLGTKAGDEGWKFKIHTPLQKLTKAQIIRLGTKLGVDYSLTNSCYDPDSKGRACGKCDSCRLRRKGFTEAGIKDPTLYSG